MSRHPVRLAHAHSVARWALSRTPSRVLARHWGVSDARARHLRTDDPRNPFTFTVAMIADPEVDGPCMVAACLEALEARYMTEAQESREKMQARLVYLMDRQLEAENAVRRAERTGSGTTQACLDLAAVLIEVAAVRNQLGMD